VGSTEIAARLGDRPWSELLVAHHAIVRQQLDRFRGREIDTAGDGFMASFDGPARAIRCAIAVAEGVRGLGIELRAGLHTGECQVIGERLAGIAVNVAARICGLAEPGEVLTSGTVRDLVAGSGIRFEDRGLHDLKGLAEAWHLYRVGWN
jgi:class 3 adenylate cyclase